MNLVVCSAEKESFSNHSETLNEILWLLINISNCDCPQVFSKMIKGPEQILTHVGKLIDIKNFKDYYNNLANHSIIDDILYICGNYLAEEKMSGENSENKKDDQTFCAQLVNNMNLMDLLHELIFLNDNTPHINDRCLWIM